MKYKLTSILLAAYSMCMAQLTVKNSAYLFVDAVPIYVEGEVNLSEANSQLYLRNDSQLLQGITSTENSGIGELSLQQDGTVNQFAYNYWCSPIGNVDSNTSVNNSFRVDLLDDSTGTITSTDALFTAAQDGISSPLTISSRWLYTYTTSTSYNDWNFVGSAGAINTGLGFTMKGTSGSSNNQNYEFKGKPNNGTITNNVSTSQWTLIGNPYPSAIDAVAFIHDPQNVASITGDLYFWEQDLSVSSHYIEDYVGGYATYTISSGGVDSFTPATFTTYSGSGVPTNIPSGAGKKTAKRYLTIGQGFMVEGIANGSVFMKNSHRTYYPETEADTYFFRPSSETPIYTSEDPDDLDTYGLNIVPDDFKRFRINVDFNNTYTRQLLMNFHATATDGFDYGLEGKSPEDVASDAYWVLDDVPYVIQAYAYDNTLAIPLVLKLDTDQAVRFRIFDIQNFEETQTIYLHDKLTNFYTNLTVQDLEINLAAGTYNDRFEIVFNRQVLSTPSVDATMFSISQNNELKSLFIHNPHAIDITEINIYDTTGKRIFKNNPSFPKLEYKMSTANLSSGVYIVKLKTNTTTTSIFKKVIVHH